MEERIELESIDDASVDLASESAENADGADTDGQSDLSENAYETLSRELAELRAMIEGWPERVEAPQSNAWERPPLSEAFRELYPSVSEDDVPDEVWRDVQRGLPAEAAYALWERREAVRREAAEEANRRNADGGWGRAERAGEDFLSPDEVRAMSQSEVHRNYARIIASMKHWN